MKHWKHDRGPWAASGGRDRAEGRIVVQYRRIADLKLDPRNPRRHSPEQIRQIARSVDTFGFNTPVLVDPELKIIAGHGRVLACRELGWQEVPTIRLDHLTDAEARAFMIADNRLTETSVWDDRLLAEGLKELSELDLEFSIETTGFQMGEIDLRIEGLTPDPETDAKADPADELPAIAREVSVSKVGDLWLLGRHRVYCGNALDPEAYNTVMQGDRATMVFTDPPYNVKIHGHASGLGAVRHREFVMASGEMDESEFTAFLTDACRLLAAHSIDGSLHYLCMDWRHLGELLAAGRTTYTQLANVCIWVKHNPGMGSLYRSQHELVFVFKNGRSGHRNNVQLGRHGRNRSNVWTYPGANSFGRGTEEGNLLALHPTVKPVGLVADAITDCTARSDVVLDAFLGSGTTVIAAERTGRLCRGLELDPLYVDTIIARWQGFTDGKAVHAATGKSFDEMKSESEADNAQEG